MKKKLCIFVTAVYFIIYSGLSFCGISDNENRICADTVPLNINNRASYSDNQADESDVLPYMKDFSVEYIKKGDINGDGVIDLIDLTMLSLWMLKDIELTHEQLIAADVVYEEFSHGEPDIADFATIKQIICNDNVSLNFDPDKMIYISR